MKNHIQSRNVKYGTVSITLTALAIVAVLIFNVITSLMATRYEWLYIALSPASTFEISEECEEYLQEYVIDVANKYNSDKPEAEQRKLVVTFCEEEKVILEEDWKKYVYDSVVQIKELFPEYIEVDYLDIWENPSKAREMGVTSITNVVCSFGDKHEALDMKDFYIYDNAYSSTPIAYNGEKMIAAALMRAVQEESPVCYFTANHGEAFDGYEFMRAVVESGYTLGFLDLANDPIPEDCSLLVTFDPKQDLVAANDVSSVSEVDKLEAYMNAGGKYMVFVSADTFVSGSRANLEGFLASWGITYVHETGSDGTEKCYLIKDSSNSLSVDGYTVLAENVSSGKGGEIMADMPQNNVFSNSTCIKFSENFVGNGNGSYTATVGENIRTVSPLILSFDSAEAWAGGRAVARASDEPFVLMAISEQECASGEKACLIASASVNFASDDHMKSAVIGNSRTVMGIFKYMGRENAPANLTFQYFAGTEIESLTTKTANTVTVMLALIPTVICAVAGVVVLVRRRYS